MEVVRLLFGSGGGQAGGAGVVGAPAATDAEPEAAEEPTSTGAPLDWEDLTTAWRISKVCRPSANVAFAGSGSGVPAIWSRNARHWEGNASWLPMPPPVASIG